MASRIRRRVGRLIALIAAGSAALTVVPVALALPTTTASYTDSEYASGVDLGVGYFVKPVITAIGGKNTSPFLGQVTPETQAAYLASLASASDEYDGDISSQLSVTSGFNPAAAGQYSATYNVTNRFGVAADPVEIPLNVWNFTKIDTGWYHTLALTSTGDVWGWGHNEYGSVMHNTTPVRVPTLIPDLAPYNIVDIAAGYNTSYAVTADGAVLTWGHGGYGQYGDGDQSNDYLLHQVNLPGGVKIVQIDSNYESAAALSSTGDVYTWGGGGYGALGTGSDAQNPIPTLIMSNATQVAQGWWGGAAVDGNGAVWVWGTNREGELGNGSTGANYQPTKVNTGVLNNVMRVSYGGRHVLALTAGGQVYGWGQNNFNQASTTSPNPITTPTLVSSPTDIRQIIAGYDYSMAVTSGGSLWVWGNQDNGEFMTGNSNEYRTPTQVPGVSGIGMLAGEYRTSLYLSPDGTTVRGAGYNDGYQLGNNTTTANYTIRTWAFTPPPL